MVWRITLSRECLSERSSIGLTGQMDRLQELLDLLVELLLCGHRKLGGLIHRAAEFLGTGHLS